MSEQTAELARRREIEDLWWLRRCLEAMIRAEDANATVRVGALRALLATTEPETSTTDPAS